MTFIYQTDMHWIAEIDTAGNHTCEVTLDKGYNLMLSASLYRALSHGSHGALNVVAAIKDYHVMTDGGGHDVTVHDGHSTSWIPSVYDNDIQAVTFFIQQGTTLSSGRGLFRMDYFGG